MKQRSLHRLLAALAFSVRDATSVVVTVAPSTSAPSLSPVPTPVPTTTIAPTLPRPVFSNLNVGTPIANDAHTLVWHLYN